MRRWWLIAAGYLWTQLIPWPLFAAAEMDARFSAGVLAGKSADVDVRPLPAFQIHVESDLTSLEAGPRLHVDVALTGLPDSTLDVEDPDAVKAFDGSFAVVQPLGDVLRFGLYARAGVASRLAAAVEGADRLPAYGSVGLDFRNATGYLQVGIGPDQRLSGESVPTVSALAGVKLGERAGLSLWLTGSVIRALDLSAYGYRPPPRDWWTLSVQVAR